MVILLKFHKKNELNPILRSLIIMEISKNDKRKNGQSEKKRFPSHRYSGYIGFTLFEWGDLERC